MTSQTHGTEGVYSKDTQRWLSTRPQLGAEEANAGHARRLVDEDGSSGLLVRCENEEHTKQ